MYKEERFWTGLYVTTEIKGKAAFVARRARTNDAGVITDQDGENESRLKRLYSASSAFKFIASHYRSPVIDISIRPTFYFFTHGLVAFIDYPRHYAKDTTAELSATVKPFALGCSTLAQKSRFIAFTCKTLKRFFYTNAKNRSIIEISFMFMTHV